jgi:hypothetical protein
MMDFSIKISNLTYFFTHENMPTESNLNALFELFRPTSSDEEKWVGLYLVPRLVSPENEQVIRTLIPRIPWSFLSRLLSQGFFCGFKLGTCR